MKFLFCPTSILILLIFPFSIHPAYASTIHVPAEQPTIQAGIDAAVNGDVVLVAPGTYVENLYLRDKVIVVQSEAGANVTTIDGNQAGSVVTFHGNESAATVLDGFTITSGYDFYGGGIYCSNAMTIRNCTITNNVVAGTHARGGGIYVICPQPASIVNCTIMNNIIGGDFGRGAGIFCGPNSSVLMINCAIMGNEIIGGHISGGGIRLDEASATIPNCTITGNGLIGDYARGGGIYLLDASLTITNSTISRNYLIGGVFPTCGGIYCETSDLTMTNCIVWDISPPEIYVDSASPVVTYSDVKGGWPGVGNINANPLFALSDNYHLASGSPCIDAGTDVGVDIDIDGDARPQGTGFDIGADEFVPGSCFIEEAIF